LLSCYNLANNTVSIVRIMYIQGPTYFKTIEKSSKWNQHLFGWPISDIVNRELTLFRVVFPITHVQPVFFVDSGFESIFHRDLLQPLYLWWLAPTMDWRHFEMFSVQITFQTVTRTYDCKILFSIRSKVSEN